MGQMIRKQIYIAKKHQALIKKLSKARGVSEAEVIRQAIEHEAESGTGVPGGADAAVMEELIAFALSRRQNNTVNKPYQWNRADIYAERIKHYN